MEAIITTIVATRTALYSDSYCNTSHPFGTQKLYKVSHKKSGDEFLMGGAGYLSDIVYFARLLAEHGLQDLWKLHQGEHWPPKIMKQFDSDILVVTREKEIFLVDKTLVPMPVIDKKAYCIGSGGDWASAYLELVADATIEGAIEYAAKRDENTKAPIHRISFGRKRPEDPE